MARFDHMQGVFGLLPTPYLEDYEIDTADLRRAADFRRGSRDRAEKFNSMRFFLPLPAGRAHLGST